jgi:chromosome segregation ATPase
MERRLPADEELDPGTPPLLESRPSPRDVFRETEERIRALIEESTLRIETQSLQVVKRALEAISALEVDWNRARSESVALEERLRCAAEIRATLEKGLEESAAHLASLERYVQSSAQQAEASRHERTRLEEELSSVRLELEETRLALMLAEARWQAADRECRSLTGRLSWKMTAPLRFVRGLFPSSNR